MAKRLWDKGGLLHKAVHDFTVGDDPEVDLRLVEWDAVASAAHARMLESIGILTTAEVASLLDALKDIAARAKKGSFAIPFELEDCHTAIEAVLTDKLGEAGKKIHTGRSRNDQVLVAFRLYLREQVVVALEALSSLAEVLFTRIGEIGDQPLPGYTHMQRAMPSSFALWLGSFAEQAIELMEDGLALLDSLDSNPLGAASGFGVPLPLDRAYTAQLLGFTRVQRNPVAVQNSRGRDGLKFLRFATDIGLLIEKAAWDMILFSTQEFAFISLPESLTSGSSIMPQKRNPDVLELLRASVGKLRGAAAEQEWIVGKMPSNYHRDFQYTKEPVVRVVDNLAVMFPVFEEVIRSFVVRPENIAPAMTDDLYATYDAYREVRNGVSFREAYKNAASRYFEGKLDSTELKAEFSQIADTTTRELKEARSVLSEINKRIVSKRALVDEVRTSIFQVAKA